MGCTLTLQRYMLVSTAMNTNATPNHSLRPWLTASRLLDPTIGSLAAVVDGPEASSSRRKIGICKGTSASDDLLQRVRRRIEDLGIPQSQAVRAAKLREDQGMGG